MPSTAAMAEAPRSSLMPAERTPVHWPRTALGDPSSGPPRPVPSGRRGSAGCCRRSRGGSTTGPTSDRRRSGPGSGTGPGLAGRRRQDHPGRGTGSHRRVAFHSRSASAPAESVLPVHRVKRSSSATRTRGTRGRRPPSCVQCHRGITCRTLIACVRKFLPCRTSIARVRKVPSCVRKVQLVVLVAVAAIRTHGAPIGDQGDRYSSPQYRV